MGRYFSANGSCSIKRGFHRGFSTLMLCNLKLLVVKLLVLMLLLAEKGFADENDDEIPAGFENIDQPRTTEIAIWFGGRQRGTAFAEFTSTWVRFREPQLVVTLLPELTDKRRVIDALSGKLPANKQLLCTTEQQLDCGLLRPDVAGVIFDATHFRADLFVAPEWLRIRQTKLPRYLGEASNEGFSVVQGLSLTLSGARAEQASDHYSWYGRSVAALAESHLLADWSYDKSEKFSLSTLYAERDWQGRELMGGLFTGRSFGLGFSADPQLLGVRIAHSTESLNNQLVTNTTPVVVYLPVRGRVEVYRNDKLLDARIVDAGRQQLDTRSFPQGAYNLTIKVYNGTRLIGEYQQLFVRSNALPSDDEPRYFFELGHIMEETADDWWPTTTKRWAARGGYSYLLNEQTGITAAATVENKSVLAELELVRLDDGLEWSAGVMAAQNKRTGLFGNVFWQLDKWQLRALYRSLSSKVDSDRTELLGSGFRTAQVNSAVNWGEITLSFGRDWQWNQGDDNTRLTDYIRGEWSILKDSGYDLQLSLDVSRSFGNGAKSSQILLSLKLSHRSNNRTLSIGRQWQDNHSRDSAGQDRRRVTQIDRAEASWQSLKVANQELTIGGFAEHQRQQLLVGGDASFKGRWGGGRVALDRVMPNQGEDVTSYVASFHSNMLADKETLAVGGRQLNDSAVIVELNAPTLASARKAGSFDILVDGKRVTQASVGDRIPVVLPPYKAYALSIRPDVDNFAAYDERQQHITLYPGNVVPVIFDIVDLDTVLGRLQNEQGQMLADAVIQNSYEKVSTDSNGLFQGRLLPTLKTLDVTRADGQTCEVTLPEQRRKRRGVVMLGTLVCRVH